jgi:putative transposase
MQLADSPDKHPDRKSIRLKDFDYSLASAYFITICTYKHAQILGKFADGEIIRSPEGECVQHTWQELPRHYPNVALDQFIIMPDHIHGILFLIDQESIGSTPVSMAEKIHGLPEIIRALKTFSAKSINEIRRTTGRPVWQRGYYEHVIRNNRDLDRVRKYIDENPFVWEMKKGK